MKHLDNFFLNHADIPWVGLVWQVYYDDCVPQTEKLCGSFGGRISINYWISSEIFPLYCLERGTLFLFLSHSWLVDGCTQPPAERFHRLHSYSRDSTLTVAQVYDSQKNSYMFHLLPSAQAFDEFHQVSMVMSNSLLSVEVLQMMFASMSGAVLLLPQDIISIYSQML
jgi:hypothetical protein